MAVNKKLIIKYITAIGILVLMAVLIYYFYSKNPSDESNLYISCTLKDLTGLDCPACGGQRAVHHLLHFNIAQAFRYNTFLVLLIPYLIPVLYYEIRQDFWKIRKPKNIFTSNKMLWLVLGASLVFGIIRNLPFYPFTLLSTTGV